MVNTSDSQGGAAIACRRLIEAFEEYQNGVEVSLLVLHKTQENKPKAFKTGRYLNFLLEKIHFLFYEKSKKERFAFSTAKFGTDISKHPLVLEADIIHLHWINQGFLSLKNIENLLSQGKKVFWTFHDMWPMTGGCHHSYECLNYIHSCGNCEAFLRKPAANDLSNVILTKKLNWLDRDKINVISPSFWMEQRIKKSSLFKESPYTRIPNTVNGKVFKPQNIKKETGVIRILFAAVSIENYFKGFQLFMRVVSELKHPNKEIIIMIAGKVSEENLSSLPHKYELLGVINSEIEMSAAYNKADVFVSASKSESFSYTCLEAALCGTPVIAYETGEIPVFIKHKSNGFLVKDYSDNAFLDAFNWFFNNNSSTDNNKINLDEYTYESVSKQTLKAYKNAV
ncbi:glycosyltransferase [Arcticibacterium luteifluviistationis]|nr:glycosyltransferase [Arcticibacterium luteifluviistationis]